MRFLLAPLLLTLLVSCAGKQETNAIIKVGIGNLIAGDPNKTGGGVIVWGKNDLGDRMGLKVDSANDQIVLTNGNWTFWAVAWNGGNDGHNAPANLMEGDTRCGTAAANLAGGDQVIDLSVSFAGCTGLSHPDHFIGTTFTPLKIGLCSAGDTLPACTNNYANVKSVKVMLNEFSFTGGSLNEITPGLYRCIDFTGSDTVDEVTALNIPAGSPSGAPNVVSFEAFSTAGCSGTLGTIHFDDGLLAPVQIAGEGVTDDDGTINTFTRVRIRKNVTVTPPSVDDVLALPGPSSVNGLSTNQASVDVDVSGLQASDVNVYIYSDAACITQVGVLAAPGGPTASVTVNISGEGEGPISFYAAREDVSNILSPCSSTFAATVKDITAPSLGLDTPAVVNNANEGSYQLSGTCSEAGATVDVQIDSGTVSASPVCNGAMWNTGGTLDVSAIGDGGSITVDVNMSDTAGNSAAQASNTFLKDIVIPTVTINTPTPFVNGLNSGSFTVTGTCSEIGENVTVNIGGVTSTPTCTGGLTWSTVVDVSAELDGGVTITVDHIDLAGNAAAQGSDSSVIKDTAPPNVTIDTPVIINLNNVASYQLTGSCSEVGQVVTVDLDGGNQVETPICSGGSTWDTGVFAITGAVTEADNIIITADIDDVAGNSAAQAADVTDKDITPPPAGGKPNWSLSIGNSTTVNVTWALAESGPELAEQYLYLWQDDAACTVGAETEFDVVDMGNSAILNASYDLVGGEGVYYAKIKSVDNAGNETFSDCSAGGGSPSYELDQTPPVNATALHFKGDNPQYHWALKSSWIKSVDVNLGDQDVQFYSTSDCTSASVQDYFGQGAALNIKDHNVTTDGTYSFKVTSHDTAGNSNSVCSAIPDARQTIESVVAFLHPTCTGAVAPDPSGLLRAGELIGSCFTSMELFKSDRGVAAGDFADWDTGLTPNSTAKGNLSAVDKNMVLRIVGDWNGAGGPYTDYAASGVFFDGSIWQTSNTAKLIFQTEGISRHQGYMVPTARSHYRFDYGTGVVDGLKFSAKNVVIDGLVVKMPATGSGKAIEIINGVEDIVIKNNIIYGVTAGAGKRDAIHFAPKASGNARNGSVFNNIIHDINGSALLIEDSIDTYVKFFHNSVHSANIDNHDDRPCVGFAKTPSAVFTNSDIDARNNIVMCNGLSYAFSVAANMASVNTITTDGIFNVSSSNNITNDATATILDAGSYTSASIYDSGGVVSNEVNVQSIANKNFLGINGVNHLGDDAGEDLSPMVSSIPGINYDILGMKRDGPDWDIGASSIAP